MMTGWPVPDQRLDRTVGRTVFGSDAAGYAAARIGYPDALYRAIADYAGDRPARILEIGPGTGLATRALLASLAPQRLVAVEADPAMAGHLAGTLPDPRIELHCADFATAPVCGPFDLACCAAAFHWLEPEPAFARLRRLLAPGGAVALWWNTYRQPGAGDRFADAVEPLLEGVRKAPSEGTAGHYSLDVEHHRRAFAAAGLTGFAPHLFRRERTLATHEVLALYASYSYVRALDEAVRRDLLADIAGLAESRFGGRVPNLVLTALYLGRSP